jgi:hypothetical protein
MLFADQCKARRTSLLNKPIPPWPTRSIAERKRKSVLLKRRKKSGLMAVEPVAAEQEWRPPAREHACLQEVTTHQ